jgi:hypothetical protein
MLTSLVSSCGCTGLCSLIRSPAQCVCAHFIGLFALGDGVGQLGNELLLVDMFVSLFNQLGASQWKRRLGIL